MQHEAGIAAYLLISIAMTVWVAHTLSKNGEVFLVKCFGQDEDLARSTNHLLVVGFYLVNLGFITFRLGGWPLVDVPILPYVGRQIGVTLLTLGAMHFFNMMMIARFGRTVSGWVRTNAAQAALPPHASPAMPPALPR